MGAIGDLLCSYFGHLFRDIGQWLDIVALVVSVAGATADDPITFLWSLVIIYVVTIVAETTISPMCAPETDSTDKPTAAPASKDTRKLYRAVNYLAVFIAVAGLIFCQIAKDLSDSDDDDVNGTSSSLCNTTISSSIGASDDDDDRRCNDDWVKDENYKLTAQYVCAVLAVSEGGSDMIGLILAIPEMILVALQLLSSGVGARAKAFLHGIIVLIGSLVLSRESEGYIDADGARYMVQNMFIPIVFCVYIVIAVLVTWPRTENEGCGPFQCAFFNRYSPDDGCCSCGSV